MEPEKSGGPWQTRATIPMQSSENALTVRVVTLLVSSCTLYIIGVCYYLFPLIVTCGFSRIINSFFDQLF